MATSPINGVAVTVSTETAAQTQQQPQTTQQVQTSSADTAKLSTEAQAILLYQQGESVNMISNLLGVNVSTIDSYLGIQVQTTPAAQTATPAVPPAKA